MMPTPTFGREFAAARAADLVAQGGGPRRPRRRPGRGTWRRTLGSLLVSIRSRVIAGRSRDEVAREVTVR